MRRIFICYRRDETEFIAGALGRELRARYGSEQVFRDKENIAGGDSWRRTVLDAIDRESTLLMLIGANWAETRDSSGNRRLDNPEDPLRMELFDALRDGAKIVPVLLGEAKMPSETQLPEDLRFLAELNAVRLRDGDWEQDLANLHAVLDASGFQPRLRPSTRLFSPSFAAASLMLAISALGLVTVALAPDFLNRRQLNYLGGVGFACLLASIFAARDHKLRGVQPRWPSKIAPWAGAVAFLTTVNCIPDDPNLNGSWTDGAGTSYVFSHRDPDVEAQFTAADGIARCKGKLVGDSLKMSVVFAGGSLGSLDLVVATSSLQMSGLFSEPNTPARKITLTSTSGR